MIRRWRAFQRSRGKSFFRSRSVCSTFLPSVTVELGEEGARKVFRLIDALEDSDDVQNVYANFDVSDAVMEAVG